jgi:hypothetical protein
MPLNVNDVGYDYEAAVAVTAPIVFTAGKGFGKITVQSDSGEVMVDVVGNKGTRKQSSFAFYIPGNSKKLLGWCTLKNVPMVLCI